MSSPHGRANVSVTNPRAFAVCDRCGFLYNQVDLSFQYEWFGAQTQNTNMLVCNDCLDNLQEQFRTIVLPADPQPIQNPRPGTPTHDNNPPSSLGISIGTMNQGGGLDAAFDMGSNKPYSFCAQSWLSLNGLNNYIGKYWYGLNPLTANRFVATAPNNAKFFGGGITAFKFQGSQENVAWADLYVGFTLGTVGEVIDVTITPTTGYMYHRILFAGDGANSISVAQLTIYAAGGGET